MSRLIPETLRIVSGGPLQKPFLPFEPAFRSPDHPRAARLRERYELQEIAGEGTDFERARRLKTWLRGRWDHGWDNEGQRDALEILARAERGGSFNCGFYAHTFVQCCLAVGLPARQIGLARKGVDFPDTCWQNAGHVVVDVYCRELGKWVLLDADANAFFEIDGVPASSMEVHRSWHTHRGEDAKLVCDAPPFVIPSSCPAVSDEYLKRMFRELLRHDTRDYYYYVSACITSGYTNRPKRAHPGRIWFTGVIPPPLASSYAGLSLDSPIFIDDEGLFDWPLDQTFIRARMAGRRPSPRLEVRLDHNMPFFDYFELQIGKEPFRKLRQDRKVIALSEGRSRIRARCVDVFGLPGHEAELTVHLKPASQKTLERRKQKYWL